MEKWRAAKSSALAWWRFRDGRSRLRSAQVAYQQWVASAGGGISGAKAAAISAVMRSSWRLASAAARMAACALSAALSLYLCIAAACVRARIAAWRVVISQWRQRRRFVSYGVRHQAWRRRERRRLAVSMTAAYAAHRERRARKSNVSSAACGASCAKKSNGVIGEIWQRNGWHGGQAAAKTAAQRRIGWWHQRASASGIGGAAGISRRIETGRQNPANGSGSSIIWRA